MPKNCLQDYQNRYYDINNQSKLFTQKDLDIIIVLDICKVSFKEFHALVYTRNFKRGKAILRLIQQNKQHPYHLNKTNKKYFDDIVTSLSTLVLATNKTDINYIYSNNDSRSCMFNKPVGQFYSNNKIGVIASNSFRALVNLQTGLLLDCFYGSLSSITREFLNDYTANYESFILNKRNKLYEQETKWIDREYFSNLKNKKIYLKVNSKSGQLILTDLADSSLNKLHWRFLKGSFETLLTFDLNNIDHLNIKINKKDYCKLQYDNKSYEPFLDFSIHKERKYTMFMSKELYSMLNVNNFIVKNSDDCIFNIFSKNINYRLSRSLEDFRRFLETVLYSNTKIIITN